jgi:hypothetical protein
VAVASIEGGVFIVLPRIAGYDADIDDDGLVDGQDLILLALAFGSSTGDARFVPKADIDGSGTIDGSDLALLAAVFGRTG